MACDEGELCSDHIQLEKISEKEGNGTFPSCLFQLLIMSKKVYYSKSGGHTNMFSFCKYRSMCLSSIATSTCMGNQPIAIIVGKK